MSVRDIEVARDGPEQVPAPTGAPGTFSLLTELYADAEMRRIFSERRTIASWLEVEAALARGQAAVGLLEDEDAEAIAGACDVDAIEIGRLWREARNVGYPILPLVRQIASQLPGGPDGRVHLGATTQDIMDTGLAIQLREAADRLVVLLSAVGDRLADLVEAHLGTVMAARTHAQQAVPTTFGAKLAVYLDEFSRHRERLHAVRGRACRVSLFGAGGTSAAYGPLVGPLREQVASQLGLGVTGVPWHVARDALAEFTFVSAATAETCARLAREVVDLSRTEIRELHEADGHHRGASSTMPQKANPILSESIIGFAATASSATGPMLRAMEAGHERAAGEWQIEWEVLPRAVVAAGSAMSVSVELLDGLRVDPQAMRRNLEEDGGSVMAEAYMIRLAPRLGRERAHDLVYAAVRAARADGSALADAVSDGLSAACDGSGSSSAPGDITDIDPEAYLGATSVTCEAALAGWRSSPDNEEERR